MNKLKRTAALLMAAGLSLSMLAGCGTPGQDSTSASPGAEQNTTVGAAEGYTYKIATVRWNDTWPTDFLTDGVMGDLAEEADIDIEWQIYYSNDFGEQKALLFASDDLPDAFFGSCGLGDSDIVQNKEKLLELTDLINEETMPNLMKIFEEDPTMRMACTDRNEQIYSLPKKIPFRPKLNSQNYINKEWLDNLNLEMPTNYDELKEVLIAFKEQDADGDGDPNNEIPISAYKPGYGSVLLDPAEHAGHQHLLYCGDVSAAYPRRPDLFADYVVALQEILSGDDLSAALHLHCCYVWHDHAVSFSVQRYHRKATELCRHRYAEPDGFRLRVPAHLRLDRSMAAYRVGQHPVYRRAVVHRPHAL